MWLGLLIIAIGIAAILGVAGAGIYAVPILALGVGGAIFLFMRQGVDVARNPQPSPGPPAIQDDDVPHSGTHAVRGPAHPGQENMTPEQIAEHESHSGAPAGRSS
jgi:hypothetical protein